MARKRNRGTGVDHQVAAIANRQDGVASVGQLDKAGVTPGCAARRAEAGRLHRVHRGVYAVGHTAIGRHGELRSAVLACGESAVVSHLTAASLWGLVDRAPALIDVTVACETGRKIDGIRCRRCRYPDEREITVHQGIVCTTPVRTLIDIAGMLGAASLRAAVERAAFLGLLDLDALLVSLELARGRRGIRTLRRIIVPWLGIHGPTPRLRSVFEARVLPVLLEMGLPQPACNAPLLVEGERLTVDFLWEKQRLVVETDGSGSHENPVAFQGDRWRDQILVAAGFRVQRITWDQFGHERSAVLARITRALSRSPS